MDYQSDETGSYVTGLQLRTQALEQTIEQMGEVLREVRPKLVACVKALESFEAWERAVRDGGDVYALEAMHEEVTALVRTALRQVRGKS